MVAFPPQAEKVGMGLSRKDATAHRRENFYRKRKLLISKYLRKARAVIWWLFHLRRRRSGWGFFGEI